MWEFFWRGVLGCLCLCRGYRAFIGKLIKTRGLITGFGSGFGWVLSKLDPRFNPIYMSFCAGAKEGTSVQFLCSSFAVSPFFLSSCSYSSSLKIRILRFCLDLFLLLSSESIIEGYFYVCDLLECECSCRWGFSCKYLKTNWILYFVYKRSVDVVIFLYCYFSWVFNRFIPSGSKHRVIFMAWIQ